ncbi:hypothetical protein SDC9_165820 [bioreactor metagenome]|uniref:Uncharacterized protein n=1 Tax=bioreactor metagenome TaxID=1076179 RepID=A0A645FXT6_9ZZZZ
MFLVTDLYGTYMNINRKTGTHIFTVHHVLGVTKEAASPFI